MTDNNSNSRTYSIRFEIAQGNWTTEEATKEKQKNSKYGYADALIIHSLFFQEDGSRKEIISTTNGNLTESLSDLEIFKSFCNMAFIFEKSETLPLPFRMLCHTIAAMIKNFNFNIEIAEKEEQVNG